MKIQNSNSKIQRNFKLKTMVRRSAETPLRIAGTAHQPHELNH
jgi:hypothetical protein